MKADGTQSIKGYVNAAFAVHKDYKSHTGATMTLGEGTFCSVLTKQKVMLQSSTKPELVSLNDVRSKVQWSKFFVEVQGHEVNTTVRMYRDNTSLMKLEKKGKASSGKQTQHLNIIFFTPSPIDPTQQSTADRILSDGCDDRGMHDKAIDWSKILSLPQTNHACNVTILVPEQEFVGLPQARNHNMEMCSHFTPKLRLNKTR